KERRVEAVIMWRRFYGLRRAGSRPMPAIAALAFTIAIAGCSTHAKQAETAASPTPDQSAGSTPPLGPEAKIQISYSQPNDFLSTILLTKYTGADVLETAPAGSHGTAAVVRFEGGMPMWQINVEPGMFSEI